MTRALTAGLVKKTKINKRRFKPALLFKCLCTYGALNNHTLSKIKGEISMK
jgi:hypothetical protein